MVKISIAMVCRMQGVHFCLQSLLNVSSFFRGAHLCHGWSNYSPVMYWIWSISTLYHRWSYWRKNPDMLFATAVTMGGLWRPPKMTWIVICLKQGLLIHLFGVVLNTTLRVLKKMVFNLFKNVYRRHLANSCKVNVSLPWQQRVWAGNVALHTHHQFSPASLEHHVKQLFDLWVFVHFASFVVDSLNKASCWFPNRTSYHSPRRVQRPSSSLRASYAVQCLEGPPPWNVVAPTIQHHGATLEVLEMSLKGKRCEEKKEGTLLETNMAPENWWLEDYFHFQSGLFSGSGYLSFREGRSHSGYGKFVG